MEKNDLYFLMEKVRGIKNEINRLFPAELPKDMVSAYDGLTHVNDSLYRQLLKMEMKTK